MGSGRNLLLHRVENGEAGFPGQLDALQTGNELSVKSLSKRQNFPDGQWEQD